MIQQITQRMIFFTSLMFFSCVHANEDQWIFSGFATLGAVRSNTNLGTFVIPGQTSGATQSFDFGVDSKIGVQGTYKLDSQFSVTAQFITKENNQNNWSPKTEWLFGKIQAQPNLSFRLGRMGLPAFLVSDFRDVNFANLWTRPPLDVYGQVPLSHFDGADVTWDWPIGNMVLSTQFLMGQSRSSFQGLAIQSNSLVGINATADLSHGIKLRFGQVKSKLSIQENQFLPNLLAVLPEIGFGKLAEQLNPYRRNSTFSGLGISYDEGRWIAIAEYTTRRNDGFLSDTSAWYATLGHRFGNITPYMTIGQRTVDSSNVVNVIPVTPIPSLEILRLVIDDVITSQLIGQRTLALGLRWDIYPNISFKTQIERVRTKNSYQGFFPSGQFIHMKPAFQGATLLGISVDVLF